MPKTNLVVGLVGISQKKREIFKQLDDVFTFLHPESVSYKNTFDCSKREAISDSFKHFICLFRMWSAGIL